MVVKNIFVIKKRLNKRNIEESRKKNKGNARSLTSIKICWLHLTQESFE